MNRPLIPNRNVKDTLFRRIFSDPVNLLDLYNAINDSHYTDPSQLQIMTLNNVIYMAMKNDLSFLIDYEINLYEHQSTVNPNMPLRGVFYFAHLYQEYLAAHQLDIYSSSRIDLPVPRYVVFYNGKVPMPDLTELLLSDSFRLPKQESDRDTPERSPLPALECRATLLNINASHNQELMAGCRALSEYSQFIQQIRNFQDAGHSFSAAVDLAIDYCVDHDLLKTILTQSREEARLMILEEYDHEFHVRKEKELSFNQGVEEGVIKGIEQGIDIGIAQGAIETSTAFCRTYMKNSGASPDEAVAFLNVPEEIRAQVLANLTNTAQS